MREVNIRQLVRDKRRYSSNVILLYTDVYGKYILEVKDEPVFIDDGSLWFKQTDNRLINAYLKQIKEVYKIDNYNNN